MRLRIWRKSFLIFLGSVLGVILVVFVILNLPFSQRYATRQVNQILYLAHVPIQLDAIRKIMPGSVSIQGIAIGGSERDTIIYVGELHADIRLLSLLKSHVMLKEVLLDGALVELTRKQGMQKLNIAEAFQSEKKKEAVPLEKKPAKWKISIRKGALTNIHFRMQDSLSGIHIAEDASEIEIGSFRISLPDRDIRCKSLFLGESGGFVNLGPRLIPPKKRRGLPWNMGFQKLELDAVDFSFFHAADSLKLATSIDRGSIKANKFDLRSRTVDLKQLSLSRSMVRVHGVDASEKQKKQADAGEDFFQWIFGCEDLDINKSVAMLGLESMERIEEIDIHAENLRYNKDQVGMKIRKMAFVLENGFSIRKMSGRLNSDSIETRIQLDISSANSHVVMEAYAESELQGILFEPGELSKATLDMDESHISLADLSCFLEDLDTLGFYATFAASPLDISAKLNMEASHLSLTELSLSQDKNYLVKLAGDIGSPFHPSEATGKLDFEFSGLKQAWAEALASELAYSRSIPTLSDLSIRGTISDSLLSPDIHVRLQSQWGKVDLGGRLNFKKELFTLACSFQRVSLGDLLINSDLGYFTAAGEIKGSGYSGEKIEASYYLQLDTLGYKSHDYIQTQLTGSIAPGKYKMQLVAKDPSLQGDLDVLLSLGDSIMQVEASGILKAQLNQLHLYEDTLLVETSLEASLSSRGKVLESNIQASGIRLSNPWQNAFVQELSAEFKSDSLSSSFIAESDFFYADLHIQKPLHELDSLGKEYQNYFESFREASHITAANRVAVLPEINATGYIDYHELLDIFLEDTGLHFNNLGFSINKQEDRKSLRASLWGDELSLRMFDIGKLSAALTDSAGSILVNLVADTTSVFSGPENRVTLGADFSHRSMLARLSVDNYMNQSVYDIDLAGKADSNQIVFGVPSQMLTLNGRKWDLEGSELLSIDLKTNKISPTLQMRRDSSYFQLSSEIQDPNLSYTLDLNQVELASLVRTDIFTGSPGGVFTGSLNFRTDRDSTTSLNTSMLVSDIVFSGKAFNDVQVDGALSMRASGLNAIEVLARMDSIHVQLNGERNADGEGKLEGVLFHFPLVTLEPFTEKYLSDLKGSVSGRLNISSQGGSKAVSGQLNIRDAGLKVDMLNNAFRIPSQDIQIADERMIFREFTILDTLNRPLTLDGFLDFSNPGTVNTDLIITSAELQVMSRDHRSKAPFSGNIVIDSRVSVKGPMPRPDISGRIHLSEGTEIFYHHMEDLRITETDKIVNFIEYDSGDLEYDAPGINRPTTLMNSSIETVIEVDPSTKINFTLAKRMFNIFLDVQGGGNVRYNMENERMTVDGRYEIGGGKTLLKLVGWPDKTFKLAEGGFISWDGIIENPELSLKAENKVSTSYVNPIDNSSREIDFFVILSLSGYLSDLNVLFTIRTPDQYVMSVINTLGPEEQMRQAISVLLFEAIDLPGISSSTDYMTQQVNQILSSQLNQLTKSTIKGVDISFGLDTYDQSSQDGSDATTTSLSYDVSKSLMNNRAQIEVSGRFNDDNQSAGSSDHSLNNVSFEYQLDSAASKYLKVYNEHTYDDVFEGEVIKTGIGFTYRKRYKTFRDIWKKKR